MNIFFLLFFPRRHGKVRDSDEENDPDDEDAIANAVGCLGPFSGLLASELQKYQKQMKGKNVALYASQCVGSLYRGIVMVSYKCLLFPELIISIKDLY